MIAEHDAGTKFQVISKMGVGILELKAQVLALTAQVEAERARAEKAERLARLYEAQLLHPKKEIKTLVQSISELRPEDIARSDRDLADLRNQGWEALDITVTVCVIGSDSFHDRIITLERATPISVEPDQPAATVAAAEPVAAEATEPAVPATPDPAPESNPDALPVSRKTVTASAILEPGEMPAIVDPAAIEVDPPMTRGEEVQVAAKQAYEAALARNPLPARRPLSSFKPVQGSAPQ